MPFSYTLAATRLTARLPAMPRVVVQQEHSTMKPDSRPSPAEREQAERAGQAAKTPNPDMQAEDAGSTDSGTAASQALPQSGKTDAESGGRRSKP